MTLQEDITSIIQNHLQVTGCGICQHANISAEEKKWYCDRCTNKHSTNNYYSISESYAEKIAECIIKDCIMES